MKQQKESYSLGSNIRYIYQILFREQPRTKYMLAGQVLLIVALPLTGNLMTAAAVAAVTGGSDPGRYALLITTMLSAMGLLSCLQHGVTEWNEFYIESVQNRKFLMGLVEKSLDADYENVESQKQQRLLNQASHAVNVYRQGVGKMYYGIPVFAANAIGTLIYSLTISVLDIRILLVILIMTTVGMLLEKRARNITESMKEEQFRIWGRIYYLKQQAMSVENGKDIRIYNMAEWFRSGFLRLLRRNLEMESRREKGWFCVSGADSLFILARDILAYAILIAQVMAGSLSLAEFTFCLGVVSGISNWIGGMRDNWAQVCDGSRMLRDNRRMMDYPNRFLREGGLTAAAALKDGAPEIEFRNVSFQYEEGSEYILKNLNVTIRSGEKIALVGHNGAGKSTLVKLLCGFYHPTKGEILVGGHSIEEYNLNEYYKLLSTIFQESNMLPFSIVCNVSGETEEQTDLERVWECLEIAGISEDIARLENREMTYLTQTFRSDGIELSGGMAQKLMLARAVYKDAPVLVLDEPTAALDPIAESRVYQEYNRIAHRKTSLFISHRLASTRFCDRILYLEKGEILEQGTHEELLKQCGKYAEMFQIQSKYYQEGASE
ncbi:MAG: ABC transporter ATP-binding protein/permease [Acetatifactor sp.]|nr:ABC transporter ATP-binding protein/permease [Acetatifactor sp.]